VKENLTCDEILRGRLKLWQPREGYRFAVDPLLLLHFIHLPRISRAADLGTGCGIIALGLALRFVDAQVTAVELQPRLAQLALRNAAENQLTDRVQVLELDLANPQSVRAALSGASYDLVTCNPPFRPLGEGNANPDDEAAVARHELRLTLADVARESRRLLLPGGRAVLVYPAERLGSLLSSLEREGLRPLRLRCVHPRVGEPATRVLVEARKGAKGNLVVEGPMILRDESGEYTAEARHALGD
jgi:tRNA1Val (adenine37-N6)-methyltransferase